MLAFIRSLFWVPALDETGRDDQGSTTTDRWAETRPTTITRLILELRANGL